MSSTETEFVNGLIVKAPNDNAPEYVKAKLSFKIDEMIAWLTERKARGDAWANADVKVGQSGKWYAAVDNWKPDAAKAQQPRQESPKPAPVAAGTPDFADDDIPFDSGH